MASLLEKAKSHKSGRIARKSISPELIELAFAWMEGEITLQQATVALGNDKKHSANTLYTFATVFREAFQRGRLVIRKSI